MQGTVAIFLGVRNVIIKLPGNRLPVTVHHAQHLVALRDRIHQHPHGAYVEDLGKIHTLALHLLPDAVDVLGTATDLSRDAVLLALLLQTGDHLFDEVLPLFPFSSSALAICR